MTSPVQDQGHFDAMPGDPPVARVGKGPGTIVLAGALWPAEATAGGKLTRDDVRTALAEARALSEAGLVKVSAALTGDSDAIALMTLWFGPRPAAGRDWWLAVKETLTRINAFMLADIRVYYRGADALGKPNDYPGKAGAITAHGVAGYAETMGDARDGIIGLCSDFFARTHKGERTINQTGFDSVGGVLIHELSHNVAGTTDHVSVGGGNCYGVVRCKALAVDRPSRAWYNADNIEYFCEQARYGVVPKKPAIDTEADAGVAAVSGTITAPPPPAPAKPPVVTGASTSVKNLRDNF